MRWAGPPGAMIAPKSCATLVQLVSNPARYFPVISLPHPRSTFAPPDQASSVGLALPRSPFPAKGIPLSLASRTTDCRMPRQQARGALRSIRSQMLRLGYVDIDYDANIKETTEMLNEIRHVIAARGSGA